MKINRRAVKNICRTFNKTGIPYVLKNFVNMIGLPNAEDSHTHITEEQIKEYRRMYLEAMKTRNASNRRKHRRNGEENEEPYVHRVIY